jgi:TonB family protein
VIAWLAYALALSALAGLCALAADRAARLLGSARRGVWATALAFSVFAPLAALWPASSGRPAGAAADPGGAATAAVGEISIVAMPAASSMVDAWVAAGLLGVCVLALGMLGWGVARLAMRRRGWRRAVMDGEPVLVSRDTGPAVVGVLRGEIVVPRWAFGLDAADRACLLAHERSHLRARDPLLFAAALVLAALSAWNPVVWWHVRRLRLAIELDCDARVIRTLDDPRTYGRALLAVGGLRSGRPQPLMAFAERAHHLEQRILDMTERRPHRSRVRAAALAAAAALVAAAACAVPRPAAHAPELSLASLRGTATPMDVPFGAPAAAAAPAATPPSATDVPFGAPAAAAAPAATISTPAAPPASGTAPTSASGPSPAPPPLATDTPVVDVGERPTFTPRTREPELPADQRRMLMEYLERNYPQALRAAGIGSRTTLWVFIDEQGRTGNTRIVESSGYPEFDDIVQRAVRTVSWHPAMNRDARVPVWIQLPVAYQVRRDVASAPDARPAEPPTAGQPRLLNRDEVVAAATRAAGGAHGRAEVWISVDVAGTVDRVRLAEGSGIDALDRAALEAAAVARFEPARRGDEAVPTWIRFPVVLQPARD